MRTTRRARSQAKVEEVKKEPQSLNKKRKMSKQEPEPPKTEVKTKRVKTQDGTAKKQPVKPSTKKNSPIKKTTTKKQKKKKHQDSDESESSQADESAFEPSEQESSESDDSLDSIKSSDSSASEHPQNYESDSEKSRKRGKPIRIRSQIVKPKKYIAAVSNIEASQTEQISMYQQPAPQSQEEDFDGPSNQRQSIAWQNMTEVVDQNKDGPWFTQSEHIMDEQERRPSDPNYDPSTVFIPQSEWDKFTPGMHRYWEIKQKNFDKIVLYRFGQWFIVYFQDAYVCTKLVDLCIPPRQTHQIVGFHQTHLEQNIETLCNAGYKVAVCEQTENGQQMEIRLKKEKGMEGTDQVKAVKREVAQIFTKGTHFKLDFDQKKVLGDYDTKHVLSFYQSSTRFGYCYFDMSTLKFCVGQFEDDFTLKQFRTLVMQTKPVEFICTSGAADHTNIRGQEVLKILLNSPCPPTQTQLSYKEVSDPENILSKYLTADAEKWPKELREICSQKKESRIALGLTLLFLEKLLLLDSALPVSTFEYQNSIDVKSAQLMMIDAQAIEHLDILPPVQQKNDHSLFSFLSQGVSTAFGKRMLKRWVVSPLFDAQQISQRQDAVSDLVQHPDLRASIHDKLKVLPDLERLLTRIFTYSVKSKVKAFYVDQQVLTRLEEFHRLMETLKKMGIMVESLFEKQPIKSKRLLQLTQSEGGLFPDYLPILKEFDEMITWKRVGNQRVPEPVSGLDQEFDACNEEVDEAKKELDNYLAQIKKETKCGQACFSFASKKFRYEIELPNDVDVDQDEFICTSKTKNNNRYQTDRLRELISLLEEKEELLKSALAPFLRGMFNRFYQFRQVFQNACSCVAELDCLNSLAVVSDIGRKGDQKMCRPKVIGINDKTLPFLMIKQIRHPCIENLTKRTFVPNDVHLNGEQSTLLITGPNMGGKSTLLRQVCIAAIMAQIGCYVAAKECTFSLVDRIFTRIGASDRILENKSTFFVELEETKAICELATRNSFVIMDELGRGTSTFDGYAIAHSVLTYLTQKTSCRMMFTTHYHMLVEDFRLNKAIGLYQMACDVVEQTDSEIGKKSVGFNYRFVEGVAQKSFGLYVAEVAGVNQKVLAIARSKAAQFDDKIKQLVAKVNDLNLTQN